jgi:glycosyltransferase involved in cell wall biosynthesis
MKTIAAACNFYNEVNALPGFLESATQFFDELVMVNCGPDGKLSDDGSLDILRKWGIPWEVASINPGFGHVRTELIRRAKSDWVMIMDCDERFHRNMPLLRCEGDEKYPELPNPKLTVTEHGIHRHGETLRAAIEEADRIGHPTVLACRRHWFDFTFRRPCQNWHKIEDLQLRIVKNIPQISYRANVKMHERIVDERTGGDPKWVYAGNQNGVFFDHYHCHFKPMEADQRAHDVRIYDALDQGKTIPIE